MKKGKIILLHCKKAFDTAVIAVALAVYYREQCLLIVVVITSDWIEDCFEKDL